MNRPTYDTYIVEDEDFIEPGHEVEDRHTGDRGIVAEVTARGIVIVKWETEYGESLATPDTLIHL